MKKHHDKIIEDFLIHSDPLFAVCALYVPAEDTFYLWENDHYRPLSDTQVKDQIWKFLINAKTDPDLGFDYNALNVNDSLIKSLHSILKLAHTNRAETTLTSFISLNDGMILDTSDLSLHQASRQIHSFHRIDFSSKDLSKDWQGTRFQQFLNEVLVDEDEAVDKELGDFVQEVFGYALLQTIQAHASFIFYGSGRNGKSVLLRLLETIIGRRHISYMNLQTLTTGQFARAGLIGKKLNIANEEESRYMKSDMFKALVAGDRLTVDRKYRDPIEIQPMAKFFFATNQLPVFDSTDQALRDRIYIIPFNRYFKESERDPDLITQLETELGHVLAWSMAGAKRLIERGLKFNPPKQVREQMKQFEDGQSSAIEFFNENYIVTENHGDYIIKSVMYGAYQNWCDSKGRQAKSDARFFQDLKNIYSSKINLDARKTEGDRQRRVVTGVKRTDDKTAFIYGEITFSPNMPDGYSR